MDQEAILELSRDLKAASAQLSADEARYLVNYYYTMQRDRIRARNQERRLTETGSPNAVINWLGTNTEILEAQIKRALDSYTDSIKVGRWAKSITGIGPIIAAGLSAHIDITKSPTVCNIWRFAGLDPTVKWEKGKKRPWNADLKTLTWKIGESFVKVSGRESDFYGQFYLKRKEFELANNEAGRLAAQAAEALAKRKFGADTDARKWYEQGKLPPAHIHARAKRYAVKLFLSHWHHVALVDKYGKNPPIPYILANDPERHTDYIPPPNLEMVA